MEYNLTAYAMDFASFLIQKTDYLSEINNIILFGSVAREEYSEDSDIDIFVDVFKEDKKIENDIKKCLSNFIKSGKYNNYWKLLGVKNDINIIVGELKKWKELQDSINSNGIFLYGKYSGQTEGIYKTIFVWENIKPNSKRVLFNKQLLGYKFNNKFYEGLLQKYKGERLGKGCIIVPMDTTNNFHKIFKKYKISVKIKKFLEY